MADYEDGASEAYSSTRDLSGSMKKTGASDLGDFSTSEYQDADNGNTEAGHSQGRRYRLGFGQNGGEYAGSEYEPAYSGNDVDGNTQEQYRTDQIPESSTGSFGPEDSNMDSFGYEGPNKDGSGGNDHGMQSPDTDGYSQADYDRNDYSQKDYDRNDYGSSDPDRNSYGQDEYTRDTFDTGDGGNGRTGDSTGNAGTDSTGPEENGSKGQRQQYRDGYDLYDDGYDYGYEGFDPYREDYGDYGGISDESYENSASGWDYQDTEDFGSADIRADSSDMSDDRKKQYRRMTAEQYRDGNSGDTEGMKEAAGNPDMADTDTQKTDRAHGTGKDRAGPGVEGFESGDGVFSAGSFEMGDDTAGFERSDGMFRDSDFDSRSGDGLFSEKEYDELFTDMDGNYYGDRKKSSENEKKTSNPQKRKKLKDAGEKGKDSTQNREKRSLSENNSKGKNGTRRESRGTADSKNSNGTKRAATDSKTEGRKKSRELEAERKKTAATARAEAERKLQGKGTSGAGASENGGTPGKNGTAAGKAGAGAYADDAAGLKGKNAKSRQKKTMVKKAAVKVAGDIASVGKGAAVAALGDGRDRSREEADFAQGGRYAGYTIEGAERAVKRLHNAKRSEALKKRTAAARRAASLEKELTDEKILRKELQKKAQKKKISREYAKALSKKQVKAAGYAKEATKESAKAAEKAASFAVRHPGLTICLLLIVLFILIFSVAGVSCTGPVMQGITAFFSTSYQSTPEAVDDAENKLRDLEFRLQKNLNSIETENWGYDRYTYILDPIGHNPHTLISYLTAKYTDISKNEVIDEISDLFTSMYHFEKHDRTETETYIDVVIEVDEDGNQTESLIEVSKTVTILDVTLKTTPLEELVIQRLDEEQLAVYYQLKETSGLLQQFYSPLADSWYGNVTGYYGERFNPVTHEEEFHAGVDIAVDYGTPVYAAQDGVVTAAAYDHIFGYYIVIENDRGYSSKYAHLSMMTVSAGDTVGHGDMIGQTGWSGQCRGTMLHFETLYHGSYYNPMFYTDEMIGKEW